MTKDVELHPELRTAGQKVNGQARSPPDIRSHEQGRVRLQTQLVQLSNALLLHLPFHTPPAKQLAKHYDSQSRLDESGHARSHFRPDVDVSKPCNGLPLQRAGSPRLGSSFLQLKLPLTSDPNVCRYRRRHRSSQRCWQDCDTPLSSPTTLCPTVPWCSPARGASFCPPQLALTCLCPAAHNLAQV